MRSHLRVGSLALLALGGLVVHLAGCEDSSEGTPIGTPGGDAGFGSDGSTDGSVTPGDGSTTTDGGGDGGTGGPVVTACADGVRVDTLRGVNGATRMTAAGSGDKWTAAWLQNSTASPDNQFHIKARSFDGAALKPEQDLGIDGVGNYNGAVADGTGHAFFQRIVSPAGERVVHDFATSTWAAGTSFAVVNGTDTMALMAIPTGGAISIYRDGTNVLADRWLPATPTWTSTGLAGLPANASNLRLFVNATGRAAAVWSTTDGTGTTITVTPFDGAAWGTPKANLVPIAGGAFGGLEGGIYGNGDVQLVWTVGAASTVTASRFDLAAGTFSAPAPLGAITNASTGTLAVVVDAQDHFTAGWIDNGKVQVRRDVGSGIGPAQDLGLSDNFRFDVDPKTSNLTVLTYTAPKLSIRGISSAGTTWTNPVDAKVGVSSNMIVRLMSQVVFDSKGKPTVIAMQELAGAGGFGLSYARCN